MCPVGLGQPPVTEVRTHIRGSGPWLHTGLPSTCPQLPRMSPASRLLSSTPQ